MDKKTFTEFLIFTGIVLVIWWAVSALLVGDQRRAPAVPPPAEVPAAKPTAAKPPPQEAPGEGPERAELAPAEETAAPPAPAAKAGPVGPQPEVLSRVLSNKLVLTEWTNRGAALARLEYLDQHYRAAYIVNGERPNMVLLRDFQEGLFPDTIQTLAFHGGGTFEVSVEDVLFDLTEEAKDALVFEQTLADGQGRAVRLRKTVHMPPDGYGYDVKLEIENACAQQVDLSFALRGAAGIEREMIRSRYLGTRVGIRKGNNDYKISKVLAAKLPGGDEVNESADIAWAGVVNHYFVAITEPEDAQWVNTVVSTAITDSDILHGAGRWGPGEVGRETDRARLARQNAAVIMNSVVETLQPGETFSTSYRMVAAPKKDEVLKGYDKGMEGLMEYGLLPSVSRVVLGILNGVYWLVPNYGIAILVVTALVRLVLHPMTRKQQVGMARMQKLQPMIQELQKKYGDDKQKFTQEQLALWRKYGVNPMGGCWPMFLQLPVLFALYGALRAAIELRHAGFLWINDLSMPDRLLVLPFSLPLLGNELNVLPVLSAVAMFFTQKSAASAATTDQARQQQAMLKFMPIMLLFLFYHFPSGLCLYFFASTAIGILERKVVERKTATLELRPVGEKAAKGPARAGRKGGSSETWLGKLQRKVDEFERKRKRGGSRK